jgi:serine/threonine-protein kinase
MIASLLLNRYQVVGVLFEDAYVSVVHALDTQANREVTIKILGAARVPDPTLYRALEGRLTRESEVGARTGGHPNLVAIYDFAGDATQTLYLVLEYLPGGTLTYRIQAGPVPVPEALAVSADMARGLQVAHQVGVMHTALTPAAIYLTPEGAKVGEFGDAQIDNVPAPPSPIADMAYLSRYRAPEMNNATGPLGPETDQYSLGMILFEMLTGVPYHALDPGGAAQALAAQPRPVAALFERLTQPAPEARYPLMRDVLAAIEAVRNTLGATAPVPMPGPPMSPPPPMPPAQRPVRRRAIILGVAGVAALGIAGTAGVLLYENHDSGEAATATPVPATPTLVTSALATPIRASLSPTPAPATVAPTIVSTATPVPVTPTIARTFPPQPTLTPAAVTADMSDPGQWLIAETPTIVTTLKDNTYTVQVFKKQNGKGTIAWGDWVPKNVKLAPKFNTEVSMKLIGPPPTTAGGILFNFNYISQRENQQFMIFLVRGDGRYALFQQSPGGDDHFQARVDFSNAFPVTIDPNTPILAGVNVSGDQLSCYLNRQQMIRIPLPAEVANFSALALAAQVLDDSAQQDISIVFSNLRYEPLTI